MGGSSGGGGGGMSSLGGQIGSSLGSIGSSWVNYQRLKKADVALEDSQNQANALYTAQYNQTQQDYAPWISGGKSAYAALLDSYGLGTNGFQDSAEYAAAKNDWSAAEAASAAKAGRSGTSGDSMNSNDWRNAGGEAGLPRIVGGLLKGGFGGSDDGAGYQPSTSSGGIFENSQQYQDALNKWHANGTNGNADFSKFYNSPDYLFNLQQGQQALDRSAASHGRLYSGQQQKASQQFGQGLASNQLGTYRSGLGNVSNIGLGAQNALTGYRQGYSQQLGQGYTNLGDIRAAKQLGIAQINQNNVNKQNDIWGGGGGSQSQGYSGNPFGSSNGSYAGTQGSNYLGQSNYSGPGSSSYSIGDNWNPNFGGG